MALTFYQLLGLIVVVLVVVVVAIAVINPTLVFGEKSKQSTDFRDFCIQWSLNGYKEGLGEEVYRPYPPTQYSTNYGRPETYCGSAIGKAIDPITGEPIGMTQQDIEKCKDVCRLAK